MIIRLRGRTELGATFFHVINDYAQRLEDHGSRLYLSGLDPHLLRQFTRTGGDAADRITAVSATAIVESQAAWLSSARRSGLPATDRTSATDRKASLRSRVI